MFHNHNILQPYYCNLKFSKIKFPIKYFIKISKSVSFNLNFYIDDYIKIKIKNNSLLLYSVTSSITIIRL